MTPLEKWALDTAKALIGTMREDNEPDWGTCSYSSQEQLAGYIKNWEESWGLFERKLSIGLVQCRALECRQISGSLLVKQPGTLKEIADGLTDRSSKLERLGMEMARPGPIDPPEPGLIVQPDRVGPSDHEFTAGNRITPVLCACGHRLSAHEPPSDVRTSPCMECGCQDYRRSSEPTVEPGPRLVQ